MIGALTGELIGHRDQSILLDVNGVGYLIEVTNRFLANCPEPGARISLSIETYVREDAFRLFGFVTDSERQWFKLLMGVQGVGAKVALAVLGLLSPDELAAAIAAQDKAMIARTPGIGPKVAQRIVQELKDKAPEPRFEVTSEVAGTARDLDDALSVLVNLGYARSLAFQALQTIRAQDANADVQVLIRSALRELSQ